MQKNTIDNGLAYRYNNNNQVKRIEQYNDKTSKKLISSMNIDYDYKLTKFTDFRGDSVRYTFDSYGHTINVLDDFGNAIFYEYENIFNNKVFNVNTVNFNMNHKLLQKSLPQKNMLDDSLYEYIETRENLLINPSFEIGNDLLIDSWDKSGVNRVENNTIDIYNKILGDYSIQINGNVKASKSITQVISQSGKAGDSFVFGGWAKANATPYNSFTTKEFFIKITVDTSDPKIKDEEYKLHFNPNVDEWQYSMNAFTTKSDYNQITFEVYYKNLLIKIKYFLHYFSISFFKKQRHTKIDSLTDDFLSIE